MPGCGWPTITGAVLTAAMRELQTDERFELVDAQAPVVPRPEVGLEGCRRRGGGSILVGDCRAASRREAGPGGCRCSRAAGLGTRRDRQDRCRVGRNRSLTSQVRAPRLPVRPGYTCLSRRCCEGWSLRAFTCPNARPAARRQVAVPGVGCGRSRYSRERQTLKPGELHERLQWAELVPGVIWIYGFTHFVGLPGWRDRCQRRSRPRLPDSCRRR